MGHNPNDKKAAMPAKKEAELSPMQAIAEVRQLRAGGLFVGNMRYVDALLAEYDHQVKFAEDGRAAFASLEEKNDKVLALLNEHLIVSYNDVEDAVRQLLQVYVTAQGNYETLESELEKVKLELSEVRNRVDTALGLKAVEELLPSNSSPIITHGPMPYGADSKITQVGETVMTELVEPGLEPETRGIDSIGE